MPEDAFERALEALDRKERTTAELERWLAERGFERPEVDDAIGRLAEAGALDDERFARRFAEDKRELRGWGPERIREALEARGLAPELVAGALAAEGPDDQLDRALELLERRGEPAGDEAGRARALAYLVRRGYDSEVAYAAVRRHGAPSPT
ncbi:MAG TPA: RecX family transcriptional regulator [Solirubrobacterales bacterium]|nr:RecX family transcriptional regulator [Solirubrobacterales bacterium]